MTTDVDKTILIADDEPDIVDTLRFGFEEAGFKVLEAGNGLEALGVVRAHEPDLVVLDVMMPGENGYRVAKMIREDEDAGRFSKPIRIVLLTARDLRGDPEREQMFTEFSRPDMTMYKPFDLDELIANVRQLLS